MLSHPSDVSGAEKVVCDEPRRERRRSERDNRLWCCVLNVLLGTFLRSANFLEAPLVPRKVL